MALTDVDATEGSGIPIAFLNIGGRYYQVMALAAGDADSQSLVALGQQAKAASLPVTLASDEDELTVALSAIDNAVLDAIQAAVEGTLSVDDAGGSLTVDAAELTAIQTAVETLDNAISGSEMQVDVVASLPAGTNNIGDVDVAEKTLSHVGGTAASSGDNTLIAAPGAGVQIVITAFTLQNESATATTLQLLDGSGGDVLQRVLGQNQGDGIQVSLPAGREWKLTANTALVLNLSGANSCGYSVAYYTE